MGSDIRLCRRSVALLLSTNVEVASQKIVVFADAMGTSRLVASEELRRDYLDRLRRAAPFAQEALGHAEERVPGFIRHGLSDSIILISPSNDPRSLHTILTTVADLQIAYFREGIMLRGGISIGNHEPQSPIEASLPLLECV